MPARFYALLTTLAAVMALALWADLADATQDSPPASPAVATTETLGALRGTDGWCVTATTTAADAWVSAPARVTAERLNVRFVKVRYSDASATADLCARLGPAASTGFTCAQDTGTTGVMSAKGEFLSWAIARDVVAARPTAAFTSQPIWLRAASGTIVACVDVGF